jgi:outer membrane protein assembly factor BamA
VKVAAALLLALATAAPLAAQPQEVLADIRVHGNVLTPEDQIRRLAGAKIGDPVTVGTVDEIRGRLKDSGTFRDVQVLKRYASIADPTRILIVIVVDEGAVAIRMTGDPASPTQIVKRRWPRILIFPILDAEDGYGLSYGMQFGMAEKLGSDSRVSFPLTWGGERRAAAELDKQFTRGPLTRIMGGASLSQRRNPFFDARDRRRRVWLRAERQLGRYLRIGASGGRQNVTFGGVAHRVTHGGADVTFDTRIDTVVPRNAVFVRAGVERLSFGQGSVTPEVGGAAAIRHELDARGYIGLLGQLSLAVRALRTASDRRLPAYEQSLLGGMANLRGFHAGSAAGDRLAAASLELVLPLTSPVRVGRFGVTAFVDAGSVYPVGERLRDQDLKRGIGGAVWFSAAMVRFSVGVAHGIGATTRVHAGGRVLF